MSKAISPNDIVRDPDQNIPDLVYEAINALIRENYDPETGTACVLQKDIVERVRKADKTTVLLMRINKWFKVEDSYREAGWVVYHDEPSRFECFSPCYVFKKCF